MVVLVLVVAQKCKEQTSKFIMTLEDLRKKVIYQNTLDIWIELSKEKNFEWKKPEHYFKFIDFLKNKNLGMKKFPLCVSESDQSLEFAQAKANFAEILSENNDPNSETYTIRLNDSAMGLIRQFNLV